MKIESNISFIGSGAMATALIGGLIKKGVDPKYLYASDVKHEKCATLEKKFGIKTSTDNIEIIQDSEIVILAVKPDSLKEAALSIRNIIQSKGQIVISLVAGIQAATIDNWLGGGVKIIRCMPNTPALIGHGVTGMYAFDNVSIEQLNKAEAIISCVSKVYKIKDEKLIDSITAISGSGPAYFFLILESMKAAAENLNIDSKLAESLVFGTAYGAIQMAIQSTSSISDLKKNVTSKGGTTEKALDVFEKYDLEKIIMEAIQAAHKKSQDIAKNHKDG